MDMHAPKCELMWEDSLQEPVFSFHCVYSRHQSQLCQIWQQIPLPAEPFHPPLCEEEMISTCVPHLFSWHFLWLQSVFSIWEGPPCYSGGLYCYAQGNLCDIATGGLARLFPGHPCVYVTYTIGDSIIWKYLQRWFSVHYSMYYFFRDFTQYPLTPLTVTVQQVMLKYNDIKHKSCGHLTQFCESETQERSSCVCSVWPMLTGVSEAGRCLT